MGLPASEFVSPGGETLGMQNVKTSETCRHGWYYAEALPLAGSRFSHEHQRGKANNEICLPG
jgi:hypothetical protein